jgi:hypothetical protein
VPPPPILEIYVVWHPDDALGKQVGDWLVDHFHGPAYAGLAGGAVEVYVRSAGWETPSGPPRPLPFARPLPAELSAAQMTAVVPVLGRALMTAVRDDPAWRDYVAEVFAADVEVASGTSKPGVGVYPLRDPHADLARSDLARLAGTPQALPEAAASNAATLGRELAQAIAQRLHRDASGDAGGRIRVFVSHTKRHTAAQRDAGPKLVNDVRRVLRDTRLDEFFDAHDIQVGSNWASTLHAEAGRSALLMVRTDLYATREWTQHEVLDAKEHDLPVVALHAVRDQEDRGSFVMDHVPVIPCPPDTPDEAIERALNRLVDEALKHALWGAQRVYLRNHGFDWLPAHAPEPVTLTPWLRLHRDQHPDDQHLLIMHPDPPLGPRERTVVVGMCQLAGFTDDVDILTPRTFASRGGRTS